jgi:hypothetical protein
MAPDGIAKDWTVMEPIIAAAAIANARALRQFIFLVSPLWGNNASDPLIDRKIPQ